MNKVINDAIKSGKKSANELSQVVLDMIQNGCSGVPEFNLGPCCDEHDLLYRTRNKFVADWKLMVCGWKKANTYEKLYKRNATRFLSSAYYIGVSFLGWPAYIKGQKKGIPTIKDDKNV